MSVIQHDRLTGKVSTETTRKGSGLISFLISNLILKKKNLWSLKFSIFRFNYPSFAITSKPPCSVPCSPSFSFYWVIHTTSMIRHLASESLLLAIMFLLFFKVCGLFFCWRRVGYSLAREIFKCHMPPLNCNVSALFLRQSIFPQNLEFITWLYFSWVIYSIMDEIQIFFKFLYKRAKLHYGHSYQY